jgi:2,3-bisphosphoglycerate-independent phosphoglycerate mutase
VTFSCVLCTLRTQISLYINLLKLGTLTTDFFNGGEETPLQGEQRRLVPSPKVATYDEVGSVSALVTFITALCTLRTQISLINMQLHTLQEPAMSADDVTDGVVDAIEKNENALIVVNYANPDMVGHTGMLEAAVTAVESVDKCLGRVVAASRAHGATLVVTADHGNVETMLLPDGAPMTAHTTNPVPFIVVKGKANGDGDAPIGDNTIALRDDGGLADVAPTVLQLLQLPVPSVMDGKSLIA